MVSPLLNPREPDRRVSFGTLVVALAIAAVFYKFGGFALECLAFFATWGLIDLLVRRFAPAPDGDYAPR